MADMSKLYDNERSTPKKKATRKMIGDRLYEETHDEDISPGSLWSPPADDPTGKGSAPNKRWKPVEEEKPTS